MRSAKCSLGKFLARMSNLGILTKEILSEPAVIARCRNEERCGACEVAAKGRQHAMTAFLKRGAKSLSFWRKEPRRGRPEGESSNVFAKWARAKFYSRSHAMIVRVLDEIGCADRNALIRGRVLRAVNRHSLRLVLLRNYVYHY
jgi:hypothetical protein